MGACRTCGKNAGLLNNECSDCYAKRQGREADERQATEQANQEAMVTAAIAQLQDAHDLAAAAISGTVAGGDPAYIYRSIYLPVDSVVNKEQLAAEFDLSPLIEAGYAGWKLIGIVPRTIGVGLTNRSVGSTMGETWGGGVGGNIAGVYIILSRTVPEGTSPARIRGLVEEA